MSQFNWISSIFWTLCLAGSLPNFLYLGVKFLKFLDDKLGNNYPPPYKKIFIPIAVCWVLFTTIVAPIADYQNWKSSQIEMTKVLISSHYPGIWQFAIDAWPKGVTEIYVDGFLPKEVSQSSMYRVQEEWIPGRHFWIVRLETYTTKG